MEPPLSGFTLLQCGGGHALQIKAQCRSAACPGDTASHVAEPERCLVGVLAVLKVCVPPGQAPVWVRGAQDSWPHQRDVLEVMGEAGMSSGSPSGSLVL